MDMDDMQKMVGKAYRDDGMSQGKITLGKFIELLEEAPADNTIMFEMLLDLLPTTLDSDRGSYDEIGLGYELEDHVEYENRPTVGKLLAHCEECLGKVFVGWKGGDYPVHTDRLMNMSNSGNTGLMITGIESYSGMTVIHTSKMGD